MDPTSDRYNNLVYSRMWIFFEYCGLYRAVLCCDSYTKYNR